MTSPEHEPEPATKPAKYQLRHNKPMKPEPEDKGPSSCAGPKKRGPKPRLRSAGMSRYRRKEANARERQRQGEINTSFDKLREKIPHPGPTNGKCEKLRKIDILHVAINYIRSVLRDGRGIRCQLAKTVALFLFQIYSKVQRLNS